MSRRRPTPPWRTADAARVAGWQWQAWDMLCGTLLPELGGSPAALDLIGVNYYHNCQWELDTGRTLEWHLRDPRRVPLSSLLRRAATRYGKDVLVSETSHVGAGRAEWLADVAGEVSRARAGGVGVAGICLYPIVDRPDWQEADHWHHSGLFDVSHEGPSGAALARRLHRPYARALRRAQRRPHLRHRFSLPPKDFAVSHLIVFSHLRWNFVFQRPQHLLSRLARRCSRRLRRGAGALRRTRRGSSGRRRAPGVEVLRPHTPIDASGFHDDQLSLLEPMVAGWLDEQGIDDYVVLALHADGAAAAAGAQAARRDLRLHGRAVGVQGRAAPDEAARDGADEARRAGPHRRSRPLRVEAHAATATCCACRAPSMPRTTTPTRARADSERDGARRCAAGRPAAAAAGLSSASSTSGSTSTWSPRWPTPTRHWQVVMVGPVVKIDPASLPQRPNLHWLGQQPYELLPQLVAGWVVCLMPFALNESTRFISPTKTLEYMAAGKPVVSTPIHDVLVMFGDAGRDRRRRAGLHRRAAAHALAETPRSRRASAQAAMAGARRRAIPGTRTAETIDRGDRRRR